MNHIEAIRQIINEMKPGDELTVAQVRNQWHVLLFGHKEHSTSGTTATVIGLRYLAGKDDTLITLVRGPSGGIRSVKRV